MVATDTVVGIVGSVILVAVMAGVFAYEYNNAPDTGESGGFASEYPNLVATQDIDGDGLANAEDDDIDGDGVANAEDEHLVVRASFGGALGPSTPATTSTVSGELKVGSGNVRLEAWVNHTTLFPGPLPPTPAFSATLVDESGAEVAVGTGSQTGTQRSIHLLVEEILPPGAYRIVVEQPNPGPGGDFQAVALVHYDAGAPAS